MNLITDRWIPVIRQNGQSDPIAPWQIAEADNPVMEINAPRPDFQGALYQLLIGLLQTCFAPEDEDQWLDYWRKMPEPEVLQACFEKVAFAETDRRKPSGRIVFPTPVGMNRRCQTAGCSGWRVPHSRGEARHSYPSGKGA